MFTTQRQLLLTIKMGILLGGYQLRNRKKKRVQSEEKNIFSLEAVYG